MSIQINLDQAFEEHHFFMVYQSQHNAQGELIGYEALIRLNHNGQLYFPQQFLDMVYEEGKLLELTNRVIELTLSDFKKHQIQFPEHTHVSINIYPELLALRDFYKRIEKLLSKFDVDPKHVVLEIIEMSEIPDTSYTRRNIQQFKEKGIKLYLDDLGSGFATIEAMEKFKLDGIKVDRDLTWAICSNKDSFIEEKQFFKRALENKIDVVVEGIENQFMFDEMKNYLPSGHFQGFFFSKPNVFAV